MITYHDFVLLIDLSDLHDFDKTQELFCFMSLEDKSIFLNCDKVTAGMAEKLLETLSVCSNGVTTACEHSPYDVIDYNSMLSEESPLQKKMDAACNEDSQCVQLKKVVNSNIEYAEKATIRMIDDEIQAIQKNETHYERLSGFAEVIDKEVKDDLGISQDVENDLEKDLSISRDDFRTKLFDKIKASQLADNDKAELKALSENGILDMKNWVGLDGLDSIITTISMSRYLESAYLN